MFKPLAIISICINVIAAVLLVTVIERHGGVSLLLSRLGSIKHENKMLQKPQYLGRVELLRDMPVEKAQIIMLGDSITAGGEWKEFFPQTKIVNRGIGNDTSAGILNRVDSYLQNSPDKIFLLIGINDLLQEGKVEDIIYNVSRLIDLISKRSPESKLFIQSVLPCRKSYPLYEKILLINKRFEEYSASRKVTYIDLYSHFVDNNGEQSQRLFVSDGIHLSSHGYATWVNILKPYILQ